LARRELKRRIVIKRIQTTILESEKLLQEVGNAVDPVSEEGHSLDELQAFLGGLSQKVTEELTVSIWRTLAIELVEFLHATLFRPWIKLLFKAGSQAVVVISQLLNRD
jgi:hypothetical protein